MNGPEAFRRLANQLKASSGGGGGPLPKGTKGFFAGSGLLIALVGGGLALNASLFNGAFNSSTFHLIYAESLL
jgi:prohibitin 2